MHEEAQHALPALREQLAFEHFIAFGHSVGGRHGNRMRGAFPDVCVALITESTQTFVENRTLNGIREAKQAFAQDAQLERRGKYHGEKAAWVLSAWIDTWLAADFAEWNLDRTLAQVRCPILAIHGEHDECGSIRHPERMAAIANAQVTMKILPDCGHVPHREAESTVIESIESFLESLDR